MKKWLLLLLLVPSICFAQNKKPLTHDVYDGWKSVGARLISNDGNYFAYEVNPQEGDGNLFIEGFDGNYKLSVERGYGATMTEDGKYLVCKIKPGFKETRDAKIKKKKPEEMPKDSMAIIELGKMGIEKIARVKSFATPQKAGGWLAWQVEKPMPDTTKKKIIPDSLKMQINGLMKIADSIIRKTLDSVKGNITKEEMMEVTEKTVKAIYKKAKDEADASVAVAFADDDKSESNTLFVRNLNDNTTKQYKLTADYKFDEQGTRLVLETDKEAKDTLSKNHVILLNLQKTEQDTILTGFNDIKDFSFDKAGNQLAFVVERDSVKKALQKFYRLYHYDVGADSARVIVERTTAGMKATNTVSENYAPQFSKDGTKLFFGTAPIQAAADTNLVDFELARLDVWHYNDDYLQPQQLKQLDRELKRSYTAVYFPATKKMVQLGNDDVENISIVNEGNADWVLAETSIGNRKEQQWAGRQKNTAYVIDLNTGTRKLISKNSLVNFSASPSGKYVYWYDPIQKNYFTYDVATSDLRNVTSKIKEPLYDVENDVPDFPSAAGTPDWIGNDEAMLINDVYDLWKVDAAGVAAPINLSNGYGKANKVAINYTNLDREKRFINKDEVILLTLQNKLNKQAGFALRSVEDAGNPLNVMLKKQGFTGLMKAKNSAAFLVMQSDINANELYKGTEYNQIKQVTNIADQQKDYNWLTAELYRWKMFDGKMSEGILYKPENFDPNKKYPIIFYFYERNADGLYNYKAPAPSASTINIPWFVSNGYIVFDPNIYYKDGEPGESAYNSVVSAAKNLGRMNWIDSTRMAIQGQSWGGYQVAYLITRTNIFRAAGSGAPVVNMTSAYGGIRWGTGINRQFQYEKTQSRLGATLWQRPDLYIKNSPLFQLDKVQTPVLIMHNDADGSVPWYQGIEMFTGLKRLDKKAWLLQYNNEDHNLVQRKNRKDLSVRLGQFFDYYLKDAKPASWIINGVQATDKGRDWGLEVKENIK